MSHLSKIFEEAPIKVQNRNGFDLSHVHAGTSKTGQLVPVLTKLIAPNSTISLGVNAEVNLPPLVAPFYGKVDFAIEGFVVPCSILYGGWKQFISNQESTQFPANQSGITGVLANSNASETYYHYGTGGASQGRPGQTVGYNQFRHGYALPYIKLSDIITTGGTFYSAFSSLTQTNDNIYTYMGLNYKPTSSIVTGSTAVNISILPALAYHKICDTFYRNTKLTNTWFAVNPNAGLSSSNINVSGTEGDALALNVRNVSLIWHSFYTEDAYALGRDFSSGSDLMTNTSAKFSRVSEITFPDSVSLFSTRQRTYMRDYFTSAVPSPQQGAGATLSFAIDGDDDGAFSINSLRMANALQKFLETNNLSGDYSEQMRNRWGVRPIDADFDEPHYLGRVVVPVYQHTLYQNNQIDGASVSSTANPFVSDGTLGAAGGTAEARAEGSICEKFNVSTWSYLMVLASLVPHANYNYGLNRELTMTTLGDFPAPELQGVGMEEIKNWELGASAVSYTGGTFDGTFGYIPRYSRFKYMDDRVSGELRPGRTLESFQLQRNFSSIPQLGTDFVTIAQNALDGVLSVSTSTMNLTCWWEIYFKFHLVQPLADFCIPTLGELQDTHTIKTTVGGSRL